MSPPAADHLSRCLQCADEGVWFDETVEAGRYGTLKLCPHILTSCRCRGESPFQYWDEESVRQPCPCTPARRRLSELSRLFKRADIPSRFRWKFIPSFQSTVPGGTTPLLAARAAEPVLSHVSNLLNDDREPGRGYLFHGPPGTGKTLLSCIILNEIVLHRVRDGRFLNLSRKYFQQLRDTFSEGSERYGQTWRIIDELCQLPYLVLDDFGVQRGSEWEMEVLYDLVDARYGDEGFTIVTTNQPLEEIRQLSGGRIYSRLAEMCYTVELAGGDYRQLSKME